MGTKTRTFLVYGDVVKSGLNSSSVEPISPRSSCLIPSFTLHCKTCLYLSYHLYLSRLPVRLERRVSGRLLAQVSRHLERRRQREFFLFPALSVHPMTLHVCRCVLRSRISGSQIALPRLLPLFAGADFSQIVEGAEVFPRDEERPVRAIPAPSSTPLPATDLLHMPFR
jgi:hypothetical protein